jgi:cytoskeletal protein CcmA (bactofilin family)
MGAQTAISAVDVPVQAPSEPVCRLFAANAPDEGLAIEPPEEAIRGLSRQIWECEGRPDGRAEEHWARARAELAEQMARMANAHLMPQADIEPPAENPSAADDAAAQPETENVTGAGPVIAPNGTAGDEGASSAAWLAAATGQEHAAPSIICGGVVLRGDLESPGDLHFEGNLEGNLRSPRLDVGEKAFIAGEVVARQLTVRGRIRGRILANTILVCAGSRVEGEIVYGTLTVETGAQLDAGFRRLGSVAV